MYYEVLKYVSQSVIYDYIYTVIRRKKKNLEPYQKLVDGKSNIKIDQSY